MTTTIDDQGISCSTTEQRDMTDTPPEAVTTIVRVRFYLIRHGESASNEGGVVAGRQDVPLTDRGVSQACQLGQYTGRYSIWKADTDQLDMEGGQISHRGRKQWKLYSSDLQRAQKTMIHLLESAGRSILLNDGFQLDKRLRERSYGVHEGMPRHLSVEDALKVWQSKAMEPPPYETDEMLWKRCLDWMTNVVQEVLRRPGLGGGGGWEEDSSSIIACYHVVVSSHAGIIRVILQNLFSKETLTTQGAKYESTHKNRLVIPNTSVSIIELETNERGSQDVQTILQTAKLLQLTNTGHLDSIEFHDD